MKKFTRVATKPVRLPFNWVLPRHAIEGAKEFRFSSSRYPICPSCSLERFSQKSTPNADGDTVWVCGTCDFQVVTHHPTLDSIQEWCHNHAKTVYEESEYQKNRLKDYKEGSTKGFIATNIRRNMFACYAFLGLATIVGCLFIYAATQAQLFFLFNTLLFSLGCSFMALIFNYRAWQAMTNNLYSANAKQQFHWWVKTHPWYHYPRDIGNPPSTVESED